jgi:hypothetical protein
MGFHMLRYVCEMAQYAVSSKDDTLKTLALVLCNEALHEMKDDKSALWNIYVVLRRIEKYSNDLAVQLDIQKE